MDYIARPKISRAPSNRPMPRHRGPYKRSVCLHVRIIDLLITVREDRTGEYWLEVVTEQTERSEVPTKPTEGQYFPLSYDLYGPARNFLGKP